MSRVRHLLGRPLRGLALAAACALAALSPALAQPVRADHIEVELVAATDAAVPGQPLEVGLRLKHDPHWHTYWRVPGDSGLPTQIAWTLPAGWTAAPIDWPVPKRLPIGPLMNYGYEDEVLLLVQLTPPAGGPAGQQVDLAARADWLVCKDVCIPGGADLKLALPVAAQARPGPHAALFERMKARVPGALRADNVSATIEAERIRLAFSASPAPTRAEFFPIEEARIEAAAPQVLQADGGGSALLLRAAQPVSPQFRALKGVLVVDGGPGEGGWAGTVDVALNPGTVAVAAATATMGAGQTSAVTSVGFWGALIGALIGGLILNLMPCVFPVLSLKLLSLMQHQREGGHAPARPLRVHGLAFAIGVVLSFVLLAGLLLVLRAGGEQLGWGFQLQTPWVVAALALLFVVIGLNLLGAFEFAFGGTLASSAVAQKLQSDTLAGSFWTGVLAVVVAAPCTAPFMGAALGYAVSQPAAVALLIFAMLGVGMAIPYLLLTFFPALLARLPRPGVWMERFKQAMAFPMFATAVWLLWVLALQVDANGIGLVLTALVLIGLAAWAFGLAQRGARGFRWVALLAAAAALYAVFAATRLPAQATTPAAGTSSPAAVAQGAWEPWSVQRVAQLQADGKPVFIDFTAAWCVTCQANKQLVLNRGSVVQAFEAAGVTRLRADWTRRDDEITRELARHGRNGVPLYVLIDRRGRAQVLPEVLTESALAQALAQL